MYWLFKHIFKKKNSLALRRFLLASLPAFSQVKWFSSLSRNSTAKRKFHLNMLKCAVEEIREVINRVGLLSWRTSLMKNENPEMGRILFFLFISPNH